MRKIEHPLDLALVGSPQTESGDVKQASIAWQEPDNGGFAILGRHCRDPKVDLEPVDL